MTFMKKPMNNRHPRRTVLSGLAALGFATAVPFSAQAFSTAQAETLIRQVVAEITSIVNSGRSETAMIGDFQRLFARYADGSRISQLVLGPDSRRASAAQQSAFAAAFRGYMARKYGRRFREFIGGSVTVQGTRAVKSFYEVVTMAKTAGFAPYEVVFVVADSNGRFIDLKIEGISLIKSERSEIGAMLDKRRGDIGAMIEDLKRAG